MLEKLNKLNPDTLLVVDYKYGNKVAICGQDHVVLFFKDLLDHGDDNVMIFCKSHNIIDVRKWLYIFFFIAY